MNTIYGMNTTDRMNTTDQRNTSFSSTTNSTTLEIRVDPMERVIGIIEQTMDPERCSSTSIQLVQLPTHSNAPGVSMDRNNEPEEIFRRLEQQVRDLVFIMEAKLYWPASCGPEDDRNVIDGLENILIMERRLFQIVLSLKGEICRSQRAGISRFLSSQEAL